MADKREPAERPRGHIWDKDTGDTYADLRKIWYGESRRSATSGDADQPTKTDTDMEQSD